MQGCGRNKEEAYQQRFDNEGAKNTIIENNAKVVWDEESGQFYAEYQKDGARYRLWLEDHNSINLRTSLAHKYKLAGTCAWSLYFAIDDIWNIWDVLNKTSRR